MSLRVDDLSITPMPHGIFLGSEGGNGHNAAKEALLKQHLVKQGIEWAAFNSSPHRYPIKNLDMLNDILGAYKLPLLGKIGTCIKKLWNGLQEAGDTQGLENLVNVQWLGEFIFAPLIYREIKQRLLALPTEPLCFVSTQALCTDAIVRAIADVNKIKKWNVHLDVWMTDLPTEQSTHFFYSLKKIKKYAPLVQLHAPKPLLSEKHPTEASFWAKHAPGIRIITENRFPIREKFFQQKPLVGKELSLKLRVQSPSDLATIELGLSKTSRDSLEPIKRGMLTFPIEKNDKVITLMLGSKPSKASVLSYLQNIIKIANHHPEKKCHFFIFSGQSGTRENPNKLLQEIHELLKKTALPQNLNIIPFTFQSDEELAPLMARSDATITRSGGITSMELLHLNRNTKKITLIHAEEIPLALHEKIFSYLKNLVLTIIRLAIPSFRHNTAASLHTIEKQAFYQRLLSKGMPKWEAGNAKYLIKEIGAHLISPFHCTDSLDSIFNEVHGA